MVTREEVLRLKTLIDFYTESLLRQNWFHRNFNSNCPECEELSNKREKVVKKLEQLK